MKTLDFSCVLLAVCLFLFCLWEIPVVKSRPENPKNATWICDENSVLEVDRIIGRLITVGESGQRFPENVKELKQFCSNETALIAQLESYKSQCLQSRTKQIIAVVIYSMKAMVKNYCRRPNSKRTRELLSSTPCANAVNGEYFQCQVNYRNLLLSLEGVEDRKIHLGQICCGYLAFTSCMYDSASARPTLCPAHLIEINISFVKTVFQAAIDLICGDFNADSDRCDRFQLVQGDAEQLANATGTFFTPLLDLLANI